MSTGPITADELKRRGIDPELEGRAIEIVYRLGFPRPHPASKGDVLGEPCVPLPVDWLRAMLGHAMNGQPDDIAQLRRTLLGLMGGQERFVATYTASEIPPNQPEERTRPMQNLREFQIIAAVAYSAERSAAGTQATTPDWDGLAEREQGEQVERAMAVARDEFDASHVFAATVTAILGFNGGQGGLALERIADLGGTMIDLGLVIAEEAEGDIVEDAKELLGELAKRRGDNEDGPAPDPSASVLASGQAWSPAQLRLNALNIASGIEGCSDILGMAKGLADWLLAQDDKNIAVSAAHFAAQQKDSAVPFIVRAADVYLFLTATDAPTVN